MKTVSGQLKELYSRIDAETARLGEIHGARLNCRRGCAGCCVDEITVFEVEAENISANHADLLAAGEPHETGKCAFLNDQGSCRIYESRPYVCRTQGLPLRWLEEIDEEIYELRDICPLNDVSEPIEELDENLCWTIGEAEENLAAIQFQKDGGEMRRVGLRDLFLESKTIRD
jgi:Fe-S-cluster containining protein